MNQAKIISITMTSILMLIISPGLFGESSHKPHTDVDLETYFLLGMLEEYISRKIVENGDLVEGFYWGEQFHAYIMAAYLKDISNKLEYGDDLEIKRKQDLLVHLHSRLMTDYLNSFYEYKLTYRSRTDTDEAMNKAGKGNLSYELFQDKDNEVKYSYLAGVYFRYGENNTIRLTNGKKKAELVSKLLKDIGCQEPDITVKQGIPSSIFVSFQPTDELSDWFSRYPEAWAIDDVDSMIGLASDDELEIYRGVISALQEGKLENCTLSVPCVVTRTTNMFGDGESSIPGLEGDWLEALEDRNRIRREFISLKHLASDSIIVINVRRPEEDECWLTLTRIGFCEDRNTALAIIAYGCTKAKCGDRVAFFLSRKDARWRITNYSIKERKLRW